MASNDYTPEQRGRNQLNIILTTAAFVSVLTISGVVQSWPLSSFIGGTAIILLIAAVFWRSFASRTARPLPTGKKHARWPYLSKKKLDEIQGQWKDI